MKAICREAWAGHLAGGYVRASHFGDTCNVPSTVLSLNGGQAASERGQMTSILFKRAVAYFSGPLSVSSVA